MVSLRRAATATGKLRCFMLDGVEPMRIGIGIFQKTVAQSAVIAQARRRGSNVCGSTARTSRSRKRRRSAARAAKQAIQCRRQPDDAQVIGKVCGGPGRLAIDAIATAAGGFPACGASMPVPSVVRPSAPSISAEMAQEPSPSAKRDLVERCAPQTASRRQEGNGFDQIGLARAIRSHQHDRPLVRPQGWRRDNCENSVRLRRRMQRGRHGRNINAPLVPAEAGSRLFCPGSPAFAGMSGERMLNPPLTPASASAHRARCRLPCPGSASASRDRPASAPRSRFRSARRCRAGSAS